MVDWMRMSGWSVHFINNWKSSARSFSFAPINFWWYSGDEFGCTGFGIAIMNFGVELIRVGLK